LFLSIADIKMGLGPTTKNFNLFREFTASVLNILNKKRVPEASGPCDGHVLRLYYKYSFYLMIVGYVAIWFSWWHRDVLACVNHFNTDSQVRHDYINLCTSYLYVESGEYNERKYLLFYRWTHWALVGLAFIFYIPRKLSKMAENQKAKKMMDEAERSPKFKSDENAYKYFIPYFRASLGTFNMTFVKYLMINIVSFGINFLVFNLLDLLLKGNFSDLGFATWPFNRDIEKFKDPLSLRFPPFGHCSIGPVNKLTHKRTEVLGCHLTYMELYEKYFLVLWVWMIFVSVVTFIYIVYLGLFFIPNFRRFSVRTKILCRYYKPEDSDEQDIIAIDKKLNSVKFGDFYMICKIRGTLSKIAFYNFLRSLAVEKSEPTEVIMGPREGRMKPNGHQNVGKRPVFPGQRNFVMVNH